MGQWKLHRSGGRSGYESFLSCLLAVSPYSHPSPCRAQHSLQSFPALRMLMEEAGKVACTARALPGVRICFVGERAIRIFSL